VRIVLALMLILACSTAVIANGAQPRTTAPPTKPAVEPPATTAVPTVLPSQAMMTPVMVPVVIPRSMTTITSSDRNVVVLVPMTVDRDTMVKFTSDPDVAMGVMPVVIPMMVSSRISTAAMAGAGPGTMVTVDKSSLDRMISANNAVMVAVMAPMSIDQSTIDNLLAGNTISWDQTAVNRLMGACRSMMMAPVMMGSTATAAMSGRGPSTPIVMVDKTSMCNMVADPTPVMVPVLMDRQMLNSMMANNSIMLVMPTITPIPSTTQQ